MLVLTRKPGTIIMLGDDITITLLRIIGQQAQIGINAPLSVKVLRGELINNSKIVGHDELFLKPEK